MALRVNNACTTHPQYCPFQISNHIDPADPTWWQAELQKHRRALDKAETTVRVLKEARRQDHTAIEKAEHEVKKEGILVEYCDIKRTMSGEETDDIKKKSDQERLQALIKEFRVLNGEDNKPEEETKNKQDEKMKN
jgi:multidrug resistance efflux pump